MVSFNPAKVLRDQAEIRRQEDEAVAAFKENISTQYHSKNIATKKAERLRFVTSLTTNKVEAKAFMSLAFEAGKSVKIFTNWEERNITNQEARTLADMKPATPFSTIMCIIRDMYAPDNAGSIPRKVAAMIIIEEILFRS